MSLEGAEPPEPMPPTAVETIPAARPDGATPGVSGLVAAGPDTPGWDATRPDVAPPGAETPDAAPERARRLAPLGLIAFVSAAVLAVAEGVAIYLASSGQHVVAAVIAQVLIVLTAVPFALGLYAVVRGRNRDWGIAAMVVALVANPLVLMNLLEFFGTI